MTSRTWLITGVGSGFGRELTSQLLDHGDRVIGTVRGTAKVAELARALPRDLHVRSPGDDRPRRRPPPRGPRVFDQVGQVDAIVSDAGYGLFGAAEELSVARSSKALRCAGHEVADADGAHLAHRRAGWRGPDRRRGCGRNG